MRLEFLIRRLVGIVPILLITWTIVFGAMHMVPGDPVQLLLGGSPASPPPSRPSATASGSTVRCRCNTSTSCAAR
jgi:ABC-type dipeptide/oligopeptide/nickel transport system permease component